jgi:hypothetical protein
MSLGPVQQRRHRGGGEQQQQHRQKQYVPSIAHLANVLWVYNLLLQGGPHNNSSSTRFLGVWEGRWLGPVQQQRQQQQQPLL